MMESGKMIIKFRNGEYSFVQTVEMLNEKKIGCRRFKIKNEDDGSLSVTEIYETKK